MIIIFFSCKEKPGSPPEWGPEPPLGKGEIKVEDTIFVDRNAVNNGMHRIKVELHLPKEYKNLWVTWSYIDPDDPADDTENVDPNGPQGDDNGYLGTGEDSLPALPPKFFDEYGFETNTSLIDTNGIAEIYFQPSPSIYGWHHPGDNFIIKAVVRDSAVYSDVIYAWKRIKIEYDYMVSGQIPEESFEIVQYVFSGRCSPGAGGFENINEKPYMWFDYKNPVYLKIDEENLPDEVINDPPTLREYISNHRNITVDTLEGSDYPVYVIGGYTTNNSQWGYGVTLMLLEPFFPLGIIIFMEKIKQENPFMWEQIAGVALAHELGHYIGRILEDDPHTRNDCIMKNPGTGCSASRFCTFCIYMLRGNIYRYGRPIFKYFKKEGDAK